MASDSRISWAAPDDAARLRPLFRSLYAHDVPDAPEPTEASLEAHLERLLHPQSPHRLVIAWAADGSAVGLAAVAAFVSVSDPRPEKWSQMELKELYVLPEARASGIGAALMRWVEAEARAQGVCRIDWHVKCDNRRGIAFYERMGAKTVENRLSMRKTLG